MSNTDALRDHLLKLLDGKMAHMPLPTAVADFPLDLINTRPPNVPYTFWHLLEHLRFAQRDILDYIRDPNYVYPEWPKDYWPALDATTDAAGWQATIDQFERDLEDIRAIVRDPATDLLAQLPYGEPGHTILREVLLVVDHNAYHIGEFGILRQVMNAWPQAQGPNV